MPHLHSADALLLRRECARRLGFLRPRPPDQVFVQVPAALAPRVKKVAGSLTLHAKHCVQTGQNIHFANAAARLTKPQLSDAEFLQARRIHAAANKAKHNWADLLDTDGAHTVDLCWSYPCVQ